MMAGWPINCRRAPLWWCPVPRRAERRPLARAIAPALSLPLIAKDTIKQAVMTVLPVPDIQTSRIVGAASVAALLAVAAETGGAVLESVWHRSRAVGNLHLLPANIVEVFCRCDQQIAARRYALRAGTRAADHLAAERAIEELWNDEVAQPVAGSWPVIEVSTNSPVDVRPLTVRIRTAASATPRT